MTGRTRLMAIAGAVALGTGYGFSAAATAAPNISQFCAVFDIYGGSHGSCVSFYTNGNRTANFADICQEPFNQAVVGAKNHGQCVQYLKDLFG